MHAVKSNTYFSIVNLFSPIRLLIGEPTKRNVKIFLEWSGLYRARRDILEKWFYRFTIKTIYGVYRNTGRREVSNVIRFCSNNKVPFAFTNWQSHEQSKQHLVSRIVELIKYAPSTECCVTRRNFFPWNINNSIVSNLQRGIRDKKKNI